MRSPRFLGRVAAITQHALNMQMKPSGVMECLKVLSYQLFGFYGVILGQSILIVIRFQSSLHGAIY